MTQVSFPVGVGKRSVGRSPYPIQPCVLTAGEQTSGESVFSAREPTPHAGFAMRFSWTAISLRSPRQSCTTSSASRYPAGLAACPNISRRKNRLHSGVSLPERAAYGGTADIQLRKLSGFLAYFPLTTCELFGGKNLNGQFPAVADEIVLQMGPLASFQPRGSVEREQPAARRLDSGFRTIERGSAPLNKLLRQFRNAFSA